MLSSMQSKAWMASSSIFSFIISLLLCSMKYLLARFPRSILFSTDSPSMLFAEAQRPMARDSRMTFVRKSFFSLNVFLVGMLAFGMRSLHELAEMDSTFCPTLYPTSIFVSNSSIGCSGYLHEASAFEPSICYSSFSFISAMGSKNSSSSSFTGLLLYVSVNGSQYSSFFSDA